MGEWYASAADLLYEIVHSRLQPLPVRDGSYRRLAPAIRRQDADPAGGDFHAEAPALECVQHHPEVFLLTQAPDLGGAVGDQPGGHCWRNQEGVKTAGAMCALVLKDGSKLPDLSD